MVTQFQNQTQDKVVSSRIIYKAHPTQPGAQIASQRVTTYKSGRVVYTDLTTGEKETYVTETGKAIRAGEVALPEKGIEADKPIPKKEPVPEEKPKPTPKKPTELENIEKQLASPLLRAEARTRLEARRSELLQQQARVPPRKKSLFEIEAEIFPETTGRELPREQRKLKPVSEFTPAERVGLAKIETEITPEREQELRKVAGLQPELRAEPRKPPTAFEERVEKLVEREKRVSAIPEKLGLAPDEGVSPFAPKEIGKTILRVPLEIAAVPVLTGGRVAFAAELATIPEGRKFLREKIGEVPEAVRAGFGISTPEKIIYTGLTIAGVRGVKKGASQFLREPRQVVGGTEKIVFEQTKIAGKPQAKFEAKGIVKTEFKSYLDILGRRATIVESKVDIRGFQLGELGPKPVLELFKGEVKPTKVVRVKKAEVVETLIPKDKPVEFKAAGKVLEADKGFVRQVRVKTEIAGKPKEILGVGKGVQEKGVTKVIGIEKEITPTAKEYFPKDVIEGIEKGKTIAFTKQTSKEIKKITSPELAWETTYSKQLGVTFEPKTLKELQKYQPELIVEKIPTAPREPAPKRMDLGIGPQVVKQQIKVARPEPQLKGLRTISEKVGREVIAKKPVKAKRVVRQIPEVKQVQISKQLDKQLQKQFGRQITKPKVKVGRIPKQKAPTKIKTDIQIKQLPKFKFDVSITQKQQPKQLQKQLQKQRQKQEQLLKTMQITKLTTPTPKPPTAIPKPIITPSIIPPILPKPIRAPRLEPKKKKKKLEFETKYRPSLLAIEKEIKGGKPDFLTGLGIRPL